MSGKAVDAETGEILQQHTVYTRSNEIVRVFDQRSKRNTKHVRLRTARKQRRVYDKLTLEEKGFLFSLLPYIEWETNIVVGDGGIEEKGKPLTLTQIDGVAGISKPFRIKLLQQLVDKKVLGFIVVRGKRAAVVVNPEYALRGIRPDDSLKKVFDYELDIDADEEE